MASRSEETLSERLSLERLSPTTFRSACLPLRMGNIAPISYGGFPLGAALNAASQTVQNANYYLYSATGYFLGPTSTESNITLTVEDIRTTRTFSTRQVRVTQGSRTVLLVTADFRAPEPALLTFSPPSFHKYSPLDQCKPSQQLRLDAVAAGTITEAQSAMYDKFFSSGLIYYDVRPCPEGIFAQNFHGIAKNVVTTQHSLPLHERTTADWIRIRGSLPGRGEQVGAMGFLMDAAISFVPVSMSGMFLDDAGACSTLDFALRVFGSGIDLTEWHLVEKRPLVGAEGVTHSVGNMFDREGRLVAQMSQQSILRPKDQVMTKAKTKL